MAWDTVWEEIFQQQEWGKYPDTELVAFVARNFYKKNRAEVNLLEVGCGPGANLWFMAQEGFNTFGVDGSKTAVERARKRAMQQNMRYEVQSSDLIDLDAIFPEVYFDAILDVECLCCNSFKNTEIILSKIAQRLKPGGLVFSRSFGNEMHVGKSNRKLAENEFTDISDGPLAEKGFVRLLNRKNIDELYGKYFNILSVDEWRWTRDNGQVRVHDWVITASKFEA